jgi:F-type H+-transporting ATPase subunit O
MFFLTASLAEEYVLAATFDIAKAFDDLQLAHKKEIYCTIVTAQVMRKHQSSILNKQNTNIFPSLMKPLDKMEREEVRKEAAKYVEKGFQLVAKEKVGLLSDPVELELQNSFWHSLQVDKKILGGFVLEFEDRLVDMSDSKKAEEYQNLVDKLERDLLG